MLRNARDTVAGEAEGRIQHDQAEQVGGIAQRDPTQEGRGQSGRERNGLERHETESRDAASEARTSGQSGDDDRDEEHTGEVAQLPGHHTGRTTLQKVFVDGQHEDRSREVGMHEQPPSHGHHATAHGTLRVFGVVLAARRT